MPHTKFRFLVVTLLVLATAAVIGSAVKSADTEPAFSLQKGDHICIIGNTLAERMQHHGTLEAALHARFPQHELVIRNLGFPGDEVPLNLRLRSKNFGTPDEWLEGKTNPPQGYTENPFQYTNTKADVIFAFFGYGESYAGPAGVDKFKGDLDKLLKGMLSKQYNGKSAPRIVLFSPIAFENLKDRNLPDGSAQNKNLKLYSEAMAAVAKDHKVTFVDLFTPTHDLFAKATKPHTINGVHLNEQGDKVLTGVIEKGLFGSTPAPAAAHFDKILTAVLDKNFHWFNRYRTVDGFSTYGDRAFLKGFDKSNYETMQRELQILDVMTSNRDKVIWAAAQGKSIKPDDSNTPPFIAVKTNRPGKNPDGSHIFLSAEDAIKLMKVHTGMKVNVFASEEQFPELAKAVQMAWDTKGRLWVACMPSYPHWKPKDPMSDKIVILEDTNGDGKADHLKVFADGLHVPTGLEFYNGGVLVGNQPDLLFLKDTNGDDKADLRERVITGMDSADTHHALNSFVLDPGGALYFQEGTFHHTQVETPWGPTVRNANAGVFRYEPRAQKFDVYVAYGFANPHGHVYDRWGQDIVTDGTGNQNYFAAAFSVHKDFPAKVKGMKTMLKQRSRPCGGTEILSSRHFPEELQGNFLNANVIGFQGIMQYKIGDDGAGLAGTEVEPIVFSTDANFRPVDIEIGPDGAIYFLDWQNPIIGHMQHNLRDPSRDQKHGRIYRVTYEGRPLLKPAKIAGESIENLLNLLKEPEDRTRYRAKIELGSRNSDEVIAALNKWAGALDKNDKDYEHHMLEALWVHQYHNVVNEDLLKRELRSPDARARAAATRVLCYWRDRLGNSLDLVKQQTKDEHPRVRLEAARALSYFTSRDAAELCLEMLAEEPKDYYLKYTLEESLKTLEKYLK